MARARGHQITFRVDDDQADRLDLYRERLSVERALPASNTVSRSVALRRLMEIGFDAVGLPAPPRPVQGSLPLEMPESAEVIDALVGRCGHIEVETYTWGVLPGDVPGVDDIPGGIAQEMTWAYEKLVKIGGRPRHKQRGRR